MFCFSNPLISETCLAKKKTHNFWFSFPGQIVHDSNKRTFAMGAQHKQLKTKRIGQESEPSGYERLSTTLSLSRSLFG